MKNLIIRLLSSAKLLFFDRYIIQKGPKWAAKAAKKTLRLAVTYFGFLDSTIELLQIMFDVVKTADLVNVEC